MIELDELLQGSIDMHLHAGPDLSPWRVDAVEAAQQARQAGMRAIVLKQHCYPTTPLATVVNRLVPEFKVFGSICLDFETGGLNHHAVEACGKIGTKVIWMPTFSSANSRSKVNREIGPKMGSFFEGEGFSILDNQGRLVPEITRILSIARKYDMVVATGHISPSEIFSLSDEAQKMGIKKLVITHPGSVEVLEQALSLEELKRLADQGAFIEFTGVEILPTSPYRNPSETIDTIKAIGAEHCIISTDMGQAHNPPPAEGMRMFIGYLLWHGISPREIELMAKVNPGRLLSLE